MIESPATTADEPTPRVDAATSVDTADLPEPAEPEVDSAEIDQGAAEHSQLPTKLQQLEAEGDIAADYLEELLDIADLDGDLDMDVEGDRAAVSIVGENLDAIVGDEGEVLDALQELTRLAVYRETGERSRLMLDIGGFRAELRKNLVELAQDAVAEVRDTQEPVKLAPMTPFERKVVHDAIAEAGLQSASEGTEPTRCVVVSPA